MSQKNDPWAEFEQVDYQAPAPQPSRPAQAPQGGVFIANPGYELEREAKITGIQDTERDNEWQEYTDARDYGDKASDRHFERTDKLRADYEGNQQVKEYRVAISQLGQALSTADDPQGDNALIYAYAKAMDPGSVVRESEMGMASNNGSWLEGAVARAKQRFGIEGGGALSPDMRAHMRREIINATTQRVKNYDAQFRRYAEYASRNGIDPYEVVGSHDAESFLPLLHQFNRDGTRKQPGQAQPQNFTTPDDYVTGAQQWGQPDRIEGARLPPEMQSMISAFTRRNVGNPNFGPEMLKRFYDDIGATELGIAPSTNGKWYEEIRRGGKEGRDYLIEPNYSDIDQSARARAEAELQKRLDAEGITAADIGTKQQRDQGITFNLSDEIYGLQGGLRGLVNGKGFQQGYADERDVQRLILEKARENNGIAPEIISGLFAPGGVGSAAAKGGNLFRAGVAQGALAGFGAGEGDFEQQAVSTAGGAVLGGGTAYGVDKVGKYLAPKIADSVARGDNSAGREVVDAANRQGIETFNADVGGPTTRRLMARSEQTPGGVHTVKRAAERTLETAQAARDRIASEYGLPKKGEGLGYTLKAGAEKALANQKTRAQSTYSSVERLAGDVRLQPKQAYQTLSDHIDDLEQTGVGQSGLAILKRLQSKMQEGPVTLKTLRSMRTALRDDFASTGLRSSDIERRANEVIDALTNDIDEGLRAQGLDDAADALIKANGEWRAYVEMADEVVAPLIGKNGEKSGEAVAKALMADLKGNNARAVKFLRALPAEEQATARASVIAGLGRSGNGAQDATGEAFSLNTFLTHWNEIGETAKAAYFGPEARASLNDLARVAQGSKEAQRYANSSNTAGASQGLLRMITAGAPEYLTARMLTSPQFTRWLTAAAKKPNTGAMRDHVSRLSGVAARNPVISGDVSALQKWLQEAANDTLTQSPSRAAAQGKDEEDAR